MIKFINNYTGLIGAVLTPIYFLIGSTEYTVYITLALIVYARLTMDKFYYTPMQFMANTIGLLLPVGFNYLFSNYSALPSSVPLLLSVLVGLQLVETTDRFFTIFRRTKRRFR